MYRRPKFLEILLEIRREMATEADYDVDLFAERVRAGMTQANGMKHELVTNGDSPDALTSHSAPVRRKRGKPVVK